MSQESKRELVSLPEYEVTYRDFTGDYPGKEVVRKVVVHKTEYCFPSAFLNLDQLIEIVKREFPGVPIGDIRIQSLVDNTDCYCVSDRGEAVVVLSKMSDSKI